MRGDIFTHHSSRTIVAVRQRLAWSLTAGLLALYLLGFVLGWGAFASWHLLLVIVAILILYSVLSLNSRDN